jgi:hypothetical protein
MRTSCLLLVLLSLAANVPAQDTTPPTLDRITPEPDSTVATLIQIEVLFSEEVQGVEASDLLINGVAAENLTYGVAGQFIFEFSQPLTGQVLVAWAPAHGITDLAVPPNPFAGGSWTNTLDPSAAFFQVRINEFMADNENGIRDEDGSREDWIELYNAAATPVDLSGWYLTDNAAALRAWRFPAGVQMAPNSYLLVWASGKNRSTNIEALHTDFQLAKGGEFLGLVLPDGSTVISSFAPAYQAQQTDASFGRDRLDPNLVGFYATPTPGAANATSGSSGFASEVEYSRTSGTFETPFNLTLSTASTNAVIRYIAVTTAAQGAASTTNVPTTNSPIYSGPIPISTTTQIRARAFEPGLLPSAPMTEIYIQISSNVRNFSSDLPIVVVHNLNGGTVPSSYQAGMIMIFNNELNRSSLTNEPQVATRMGFHLRGSSTGGQAKSNYRVEYWDEFNQDRNLPFLDMPAESDWVLYGINGFDPGLMHNAIFYWLGRQIGHYSPRTRYVEVFRKLDAGAVGTNDYFGLYLAVEVPKIAKDRLDIADLEVQNTNATSITGGYLMKIDRTGALRSFSPPVVPLQAPQVGSIRSTPSAINYEEPKIRGTPTDPRLLAQANYFEGHIRNFLTNLASVNWTNPVTGYAQYIDPDQWVDNLIINIIPFNVDGYRLSGYFYKDRNKRLEQGPLWDCDRCLGTGGTTTPQGDNRCFSPRFWRLPANDVGTDNGTDFFGVSNVGVSWFERLFRDPNFWQKFIDRYQALRTNEFSASVILGLVDGFHREIKEAQVREQARWGPSGFNWPRSGNQTVQGYTFDFGPADNFGRGRFTNEVNFQKKWLVDRLEFLDTNFLAMPILTNGSSMVPHGTTVTVKAALKPGTLIYYTLDGTDPRLPGGAISPTALSNPGDLTLTITNNVRLFARCYNLNHSNLVNRVTNAAGTIIEVGKPLINSHWSGPVAATFWLSTPPLRITEIMYHPADAPMGNTNDQDNFEYLEVKNIGATPLNVNRFRIRGGLDFNFPNELLAPGEHAVIVKHLAAFQERYGAGPRVLGVYTNDNLANDNDRLVLEGGLREPILDFTYDDDWYPSTDGHGFSLQIVNDGAATDTWGLKQSWRASGVAGGTPSAADPGAAQIATIYVNEALTHTDPVPADAIELHNPTGEAVNIGGWYLTDDFDSPKKYRIPDGTSIPANGYRVFYQSNSFGTGLNGFALSSHGDSVFVFSADAGGNLTGWLHGYQFGPQADGVTFGRHLITSLGQDRDLFVAQASPTLGASNSGPKVGPIVISEIYYHPPDFRRPQGLVDNTRDEYIELQNTSGSDVPLYDPLNPGNSWRFRDAVDFTFPAGAQVRANSYVLVVGFDPADAELLADFRQVNGVSVETPIYGPWNGKLDNSQDSIELVRPDLPVPPGTTDAGLVSYILVDKVNYRDTYPWPTGLPDGLGAALGRIDDGAYGDDPVNWRTAPKTPGAPLPTGDILPAIVTQPVNTSGIEGQSATFTVTATGSALGYIWTFNNEVFSAPSSPVLTLTGLILDPNRAPGPGTYACYVFNSAGAVRSSNATLHVRQIARITQQPASRAVYIKPDARAANLPAGTNVAFTNIATSVEPPISYQWRFNGVDIPGATESVFTVTDVQLKDEGDYSCAVTDGVSTVISANARLSPWLQPIIVVPPVNQTVVEGSDFSHSVQVTGNPVPIAYSWRRGSIVIATNSGNYRSNFITLNAATAGLILTNNIQSSNYTMRLVVYNDANNSPGVLIAWTNTVLADLDRDGIPDVVENQLGLSPSDPADGALDLDSDGMSNRAEYTAGTDPASNLSYLRIDQGPGAATVSVAAVSNRTYSVQFTDNLNSGVWSRLADIVARPINRVESFTDPTWTTNRFYRVAVPRQP